MSAQPETPLLMLPKLPQAAYSFRPGIYPGLEASTYHHSEGVSKSMLDRLARSPAHLRFGEDKETLPMELGTALHTAALEPETFEARYYRGADVRRGTKAWEALEAEAGKRIVLKPADWETCMRVRDALHGHFAAGGLLQGAEAEVSMYWEDDATSLLCRARPDAIRPDLPVLLDLKSTTDARPGPFARRVNEGRYHVQAAYYMDGYACLTGEPVEAFIFIVFEPAPPYAVRCYELPPRALERGRALYRRDLNRYAECYRDNWWPAYPDYIETIDLPAWAYREEI